MSGLTVEIVNKKGLHARAAAKFVKTVTAYDAQVSVMKRGHDGEADSPVVVGNSILGLMMLGADPGSMLHITASGAEAPQALAALKDLVEGRFEEKE